MQKLFLLDKSKIEFPTNITIKDKIFHIEVIFIQKKTSSVRVKDDKLIFRLSSYLSGKQAQNHFKELLEKITRKILKDKTINLVPNKSFQEIFKRGEFVFSNEKYTFELTNKTRGIKLKENIYYVYTSSKLENIEKKVIKLLIEKYRERLHNYVKTYNSNTFNYKINGFDLKLLNSKWGHCTHDNKIMLNIKLLNAKPDILNYVICHELAHIKTKNHSQKFWNEVSRFCPNYKILRKELRANPCGVFN